MLDWSLTPLAAPGRSFGDPIGDTEFGLAPYADDTPAVTLLDVSRRRAYRPLVSREHTGCLCTPIARAGASLRIGQTSLHQIAFPQLPKGTPAVDVFISTVPPFWRVPVTPNGQAPRAAEPTDLTRAAEIPPARAISAPFRYGAGGQVLRIVVESITSASTFTSVRWRISSLTSGPGLQEEAVPPIVRPNHGRYVPAASGLSLRVPGAPALRSWRITNPRSSPSGQGCLCTSLERWATGLRRAGGEASVVTVLPPLPRGTRVVDVVLPGLPALRTVPVQPAADAGRRAAGTEPAVTRYWGGTPYGSPPGWSVTRWPTPIPVPATRRAYVGGPAKLIP